MTSSERPPVQVGGAKALVLAVLAVAMEGFDTTVYGLFALAIGRAFFPGSNPANSLLLAVGTFGVGYIVRPLGGLVLGVYADRRGRAAAVGLTVILMALSTGSIGLIPGYATIGLAAPILVVIARLVQGFSAGGAAGGSIAYLSESAEPKRRGFVASWQQTSQVGAFLLTSAVAAGASNLLREGKTADWAWRAPFILALLLGPVGLLLRKRLPETETPESARAARAQGVVKAMLGNARMIALGVGVTCLWNITVFILLFYMPTYAQSQLKFTAGDAYLSSALSAAVVFALCPLMGALSDRIGRKLVMLVSAALLVVGAPPLFNHLLMHRDLPDLLLVQIAMAIPIAGYTGPISALMAELFPTSSRSTAISVAYNISTLVLGAFGPLIVTWLITTTHILLAPALYVSGGALVSALTLLAVRDRTGQPLQA